MDSVCVKNRVFTYRLHAWQAVVLFGSLGMLITVCALSAMRDYAAFSLFWTTHHGINMHTHALVLLFLYIVCLNAAWIGGDYLKQTFPRFAAPVLAGEILANLAGFVMFLLPIAFVAWNGPAALVLLTTLKFVR